MQMPPSTIILDTQKKGGKAILGHFLTDFETYVCHLGPILLLSSLIKLHTHRHHCPLFWQNLNHHDRIVNFPFHAYWLLLAAGHLLLVTY